MLMRLYISLINQHPVLPEYPFSFLCFWEDKNPEFGLAAVDLTQTFLNKGIAPNFVHDGKSLLSMSCIPQVTQFDQGADPYYLDSYGRSPIENMGIKSWELDRILAQDSSINGPFDNLSDWFKGRKSFRKVILEEAQRIWDWQEQCTHDSLCWVWSELSPHHRPA